MASEARTRGNAGASGEASRAEEIKGIAFFPRPSRSRLLLRDFSRLHLMESSANSRGGGGWVAIMIWYIQQSFGIPATFEGFRRLSENAEMSADQCPEDV